MHPTDAQWLSPYVVTRNKVPNVDMRVSDTSDVNDVRVYSVPKDFQLVYKDPALSVGVYCTVAFVSK